jgi:hypothetical protein
MTSCLATIQITYLDVRLSLSDIMLCLLRTSSCLNTRHSFVDHSICTAITHHVLFDKYVLHVVSYAFERMA